MMLQHSIIRFIALFAAVGPLSAFQIGGPWNKKVRTTPPRFTTTSLAYTDPDKQNVDDATDQATTTPSLELPQVIQGIHLPVDQPLPPHVVAEIPGLSDRLKEYRQLARQNALLLGKSKAPEDSLQAACENVVQVENLKCSVPSAIFYNFFGIGNDHVKELILLLQSNPFMASALTPASDGGFELKSYDPNETNPSRYLQMIRTLTNGVGHKVNFKFNDKMEFESFEVYSDLEDGTILPTTDAQKYASAAIYNLLFYASCTHATIHALHFLLVSALEASSRDTFKELHAYASDYDDLIARKYVQVGMILINDPPPDFGEDLTILTGVDGFGSSQAIRPLLKEMINDWGRSPTGYLESMMNLTEEQMDQGNILTECRKHHGLLKPFATDVVAALEEIDAGKLATTETKLASYLKNCGDFESNIEGLSDWLQLMGVTGIVHGGTLSYTRFIGTAHVAQWRNYLKDTWDKADINLVSSGLGTITGVEEGRYVMTKDIAAGYAEPLRDVLIEYDAKTSFLKSDYEAKLVEDPDFMNYGFILSDYCTDTFDGKQLTMSTYI